MRPYSIRVLQKYAAERGGELLSERYLDCKQKLAWKCNEGHTWDSTWDCVRTNNSWCPICAKRSKPGIEKLMQFAEARGGRLVSTKYLNNASKLLWECGDKHQWEAKWQNIQTGKWCPSCSGRIPPSMGVLMEFAENKKGRLLSSTYHGARVGLRWQCEKGHEWTANWHDVKAGTWCPQCRHKAETACRGILEAHFGFGLPKRRFFYNGVRYEWDGFNEEHKIAFEYHGEQHYERHKFFHKREKDLQAQKQRDDTKEKYAKENGISLTVIPFSLLKTLEKLLLNSGVPWRVKSF